MNDPVPETATEELICVGGRRHGETVTVSGGAQSWTDLLSAESYYRRPFRYVERSPVNPRSQLLMKGYEAEALVHEDFANDPGNAHKFWNSLALTRLYREIGREVPVADVIRAATPASGHRPQQEGGA